MSDDERQQEWDDVMASQEFKEVKHQWFHRNDPRREEPDCCKCGDSGELKNGDACPDCCPHDETDHYICLDCGADTLNDAIGRAEMLEDR